jgi:acyl-CoA thioester hydrolase|tara:strand:- start:2941 stop:3366 length:426 start_codon:yes stop_codon:yes gene_type:complete
MMHENFFHTLKVYYEDTDAGGVVYYANYLKFLERARTEALVTLGFNNKKIKQDFGSLIVVKSCNIEYKIPSHLEDELSIRSFVKSVTKTSFFMNQYISRGEDLIVEAKVQLVFINTEGKPMRIPNSLFQDFKPYFCDTIKF